MRTHASLRLAGVALALWLGAAAARADEPHAAPLAVQPIDRSAATDHDGLPAPQPRDRSKEHLFASEFRESISEPLSHAFDVPDKILWLLDRLGADTERQSVNVNELDEVPNSTWFTNRNAVRAVPLSVLREGPGDGLRPQPPYEIKSVKVEGVNPGFNIKDAAGKRWVIKLDHPGYPQLSSGAEVLVSRLFYAAGYNLPHDVSFTFGRGDLRLDDDLAKGKEGRPFTDTNLDTLLSRGHHLDGKWYGHASLFIEGKPVGHYSMRSKRPDDPNDRFTHRHRRELRALYVLDSWVGNWDAKEQQSFDAFVEEKGAPEGHVQHYLLDVGASLGAAAEGKREPPLGYESTVDWKWILRRFVSLGFAVEPWRRTRADSGIPSAGSFESIVYEPDKFRPLQPNPAFRERTDRDSYWGAKLVASFSDAQIRAAAEGVGYEDPRAVEFLVRRLIERRDKVARFWFGRVAPLDFFVVRGGQLEFRDLAIDRSLAPARRYEARLRPLSGGRETRRTLDGTALPLAGLDPGGGAVRIELGVEGLGAAPTTVEIEPKGTIWTVRRVRHG